MVTLETSDHYKLYGEVNTHLRKLNSPLYLHRLDGDSIHTITNVTLGQVLTVFAKEESKWLEVLPTDTLFSNHVPEVVKPKKRGRKKK